MPHESCVLALAGRNLTQKPEINRTDETDSHYVNYHSYNGIDHMNETSIQHISLQIVQEQKPDSGWMPQPEIVLQHCSVRQASCNLLCCPPNCTFAVCFGPVLLVEL